MTDNIAIKYALDCALFKRSLTDAARGLKQLGLIGYVSGKEVRRLICKIKRSRKPMLCRTPPERVVIELVKAFMGRMSPTKIARLIRRQFARAAKRPDLTPDFSALRNNDGKDLDAAFSRQDVQ